MNGDDRGDWIDKWLEPHDSRGARAEVNMAEDGRDEKTGEEEQETCEGGRFDKLTKLSDSEKGEVEEE